MSGRSDRFVRSCYLFFGGKNERRLGLETLLLAGDLARPVIEVKPQMARGNYGWKLLKKSMASRRRWRWFVDLLFLVLVNCDRAARISLRRFNKN